jgi:hypothetical protein
VIKTTIDLNTMVKPFLEAIVNYPRPKILNKKNVKIHGFLKFFFDLKNAHIFMSCKSFKIVK